jgi:hypothetical protein
MRVSVFVVVEITRLACVEVLVIAFMMYTCQCHLYLVASRALYHRVVWHNDFSTSYISRYINTSCGRERYQIYRVLLISRPSLLDNDRH